MARKPTTPIQFGGHRFGGSPPDDVTCQHCGADYDATAKAHAKGGIRASLCPHAGPQDPAEREAWIKLQIERIIEGERTHGSGHHKDHVH